MLDIQIVHPTIPVIMLGDFNIVLEDRDSLNRNANADEVNARRILKDLMYDINLKDCFRKLVPIGGFTWQRNNSTAATNTTPASTITTMLRLDMILVTASKASMCTKAEVDWTSVVRSCWSTNMVRHSGYSGFYPLYHREAVVCPP